MLICLKWVAYTEGKYMARPLEQGLLYFPLDVDFFQNKKIRKLKAEYGADGITIYMYILCEIYKNGYYVVADEDFIDAMADELKMNTNKINLVLKFLLGRSLFDNTLFQSDTVLTSISVQRRYQFALQERINDHTVKIEDFWLLKKEETETLKKVRSFLENSVKNHTKESKENKSKENKSISKCVPHLRAHEKEKLINEFGEVLTEDYIERTSQYKCCNYVTIRQWILEDRDKKPKSKNSFNNFTERAYSKEDVDSLEHVLLNKNKFKGY